MNGLTNPQTTFKWSKFDEFIKYTDLSVKGERVIFLYMNDGRFVRVSIDEKNFNREKVSDKAILIYVKDGVAEQELVSLPRDFLPA